MENISIFFFVSVVDFAFFFTFGSCVCFREELGNSMSSLSNIKKGDSV